ncbi:MAG: DUF115 domain-containing protein [Treponema sp.]|jgi:hypothetical protein|nr:DUF115 domain-containing protein [Treponema sp.]
MGIAEANWEAARRFAGLEAESRKREDDAFSPEELCAGKTASGEAALKVRGLSLHSPRDPCREARRAAEAAASGAGPLLVLGFGLGYEAEALAGALSAAGGERPLIIIEKHREILRHAFAVRDLRGLLSYPKLILILGTGAKISSALGVFGDDTSGTPSGPPRIVKNRALVSLDRDFYAAVEAEAHTWASRQGVNQATARAFGGRWERNLKANLPALRDLPGVCRLEGLLEGAAPVFLAAGGPSLDDAGPFLRDAWERCLVIAVDTSLRFLLARGIAPDFVVSVDPQYWNYRHLDRQDAPETSLVAEPAVYPPCLRRPFAGVFLAGSSLPLGRRVEERVDRKGDLAAGGSVAATAWDFARTLRPSSIWIAGLDLAFPGLKTHFKGAVFEDRALAESARLCPAETWALRALLGGQPFRARDTDGGQVLSDRRLSLYAAWFASRFERYPGLANYRLRPPGSPPGLAVEGLSDASPDALRALPRRREAIAALTAARRAHIAATFFSPEAAAARGAAYEEALLDLPKMCMQRP